MIRRRRRVEGIVDSSLEEAFAQVMWDVARGRLKPLAYLTEYDNKLVITVDLPFVTKEDIELNLTEDTLEINATLQHCLRFERWGTVQRRCEFRSFHRFVPLPRRVSPKEAQARFKKGILTIELPKRREKYRIEVD